MIDVERMKAKKKFEATHTKTRQIYPKEGEVEDRRAGQRREEVDRDQRHLENDLLSNKREYRLFGERNLSPPRLVRLKGKERRRPLEGGSQRKTAVERDKKRTWRTGRWEFQRAGSRLPRSRCLEDRSIHCSEYKVHVDQGSARLGREMEGVTVKAPGAGGEVANLSRCVAAEGRGS